MKRLHTSLCVALIFTFLVGFTPLDTGEKVNDKLTRFHILAHSDEPEEQALKLYVRDQVLSLCESDPERFAPGKVKENTLRDIERCAQYAVYAQGSDHNVRAEYVDMYFDTRVYDGFALPAGNYKAVRLLIGDAAGKNWWCVLFPPLCTALASDDVESVAKEAGLSDDDIGLITQDGQVYALRFKFAELFGKLTRK